MGPLAVRSDAQGHGHGKSLVIRGRDWLVENGARVIG
jgi:predicted N-acetyltransferase YhbS